MRSLGISVLSIAGLLMSVVGLGLYYRIRFGGWQRPDTHGDSRWGTLRDVPELVLAGALPRSIILGWSKDRLLAAPAEDNALVFGVQRSGKTSTLVIPTLLLWEGAAVATSTKDELVQLTARHRLRRGPVGVFAPLDHDRRWITDLGLRAVTWNPIDEATSAGVAAEIADLFTSEGKVTGSAHWYLSAGNLLTALILNEHTSGGSLRSVLSVLNEAGMTGFRGMSLTADGVAREILSGYVRTPAREAGSIASTARSCLSLWLDDRVALATTTADDERRLDLDQLLRDGGTLYLVAPAEDAERCRPLFSALLSSLLRRATAKARAQGGVLEPRLLLALDEVANFVRVPRLSSYVSTGPGQGIQSLLCFHDMAQLERAYGHDEARTVWNNCRARVLLPGQGDLRTLEQFCRAMGQETVVYESASWSRNGSGGSEARVARPLLSVDALRRSKDPVLLYANAPPLLLTARRWDQVPAWRDAVFLSLAQDQAA